MLDNEVMNAEDVNQLPEQTSEEYKPMSLLDKYLYGLESDEAVFKLHHELGWDYGNAVHFVKSVLKK